MLNTQNNVLKITQYRKHFVRFPPANFQLNFFRQNVLNV